MTVRHHLTDELLLAYAAGSMDEAWSLAVATHLALCPVCRAREAQFAALGGATLEDFAPTSLADDALEACFAAIDTGSAPAPESTPAPGVYDNALPVPLSGYAVGGLERTRWQSIGGGVQQAILETGGSATARLLRIQPDSKLPHHGHRGTELTLVLEGSFHDNQNTFSRGDVEIADEEIDHAPVAGSDVPCVCLVVTDAPLLFRNLAPRLAQRFFRI